MEEDTTRKGFEITNKLAKNRFWGNATLLSAGYTGSLNRELTVDAGRGIVTDFSLGWGTSAWGIGYSRLTSTAYNPDYFRAFYEVSGTVLFLGASGRLEAMTDARLSACYLRPEVGLTLCPMVPGLLFDVQYSYAFLLSGHDNLFKEGLALRVRLFLNQRKWQGIHIDMM